MKVSKRKILLGLAAALAIVSSAHADPLINDGYAHFLDYAGATEDGGCGAATYSEEMGSYYLYTWQIPALADGQYVMVTSSVYNYQTFTDESYLGSNMGFVCHDGVLHYS